MARGWNLFTSETDYAGPNHVWLNVDERDNPFLKKSGAFLVLAGQLLQDSDVVAMLEKFKLLQQR